MDKLRVLITRERIAAKVPGMVQPMSFFGIVRLIDVQSVKIEQGTSICTAICRIVASTGMQKWRSYGRPR